MGVACDFGGKVDDEFIDEVWFVHEGCDEAGACFDEDGCELIAGLNGAHEFGHVEVLVLFVGVSIRSDGEDINILFSEVIYL